ncbi:MAG: acetolactate synthase large subunit [Clostridiales bacterium]|jgi:acetolactate synthase-1/2/3 large subunit|nr:acetolactate synthase large subunit [Clostridiales bacterium]
MKLTGAQIIIREFIHAGADKIFGYPGGGVLDIYDELYLNREKIKHFITAHEQGAAHAADGYARATGKTGVVIATSGPGATNLVTGIATAYLDSVPLVALTGNVATDFIGRDSFQEVNIVGITMPITKHNYIVKDVRELKSVLREAFFLAADGRPGPVLVDVPKDVQKSVTEYDEDGDTEAKNGVCNAELKSEETKNGECNAELKAETKNAICNAELKSAGAKNGECNAELKSAEAKNAPCYASLQKAQAQKSAAKTAADGGGIEAAIDLIKNSKRPCVYAGGGVIISGACRELIEFAERINAPVAASLMGLTSVPDYHGSFLGLAGMHGKYAASKALAECDLLIAAGTRFSDRVTGDKRKFSCGRKILQFDIDRAEINKNIKTDAYIVGDLKTIFQEILKNLEHAKDDGWLRYVKELKNSPENNIEHSSNKLPPKVIVESVKKVFGADIVAATDVGQHQMWTAQYFGFEKPRTFMTSGGLGTMGYGMGAAIGAAIGSGKRAVLFTSDGSFHMNLNELATAVSNNIPLTVVLLDNNALGMVRQWQTIFYGKHYSESALNRKTDYAGLAEAFGAKGMRADNADDLMTALETAKNETRPSLIHCVIDCDESVFPMIPPNGGIEDIIIR